MISKCENIVINRTKFSEFSDFDPTSEGIENLKLVGYVDDAYGKRNISIDYGALLKKNGESANIGKIVNAKLIDTTTSPIHINIICDKKCGLKIDDNALSFIQIQNLTADSPFIDENNSLDIAFADTSYALGQEVNILFDKIPANLTLFARSTEIPFYAGDIGMNTVDVLVRFIKIDAGMQQMVPMEVFVGLNGNFYNYSNNIGTNTSFDDDFSSVTAASVRYVNNKVAELNEEIREDVVELITELDSELSDKVEYNDNILNEKIEALAAEINQSTEDLDKILHVEVFASLEELKNAAEMMEPHKLSRLIALVKQGKQGEQDAYAEYICLNPDKTTETKVFHVLGDADTTFASDEIDNIHGSVVLVSDIDENILISDKYGKEIGDLSKAASGYALSPIALRDLYRKNIAVNDRIDNLDTATNTEIDAVYAKYDSEIATMHDQIETIYAELDMDANQLADSKSRIDSIEERISASDTDLKESINDIRDVIGLNGCKGNCSCEDKNACTTVGDCTILCRVNENTSDINDLNNEIIKVFEKASDNKHAIDTVIEQMGIDKDNNAAILSNLADAIEAKFEQKNAELKTLNDLIDKNTAAIEANALKIDSNSTHLNEIYADLGGTKSEISALEHQNTKTASSIEAINRVIGEHDNIITSTSADVIVLQSSLETAKDGFNKVNAEFETRLGNAEEKIVSHSTLISGLQSMSVQGVEAYAKVSVAESNIVDIKTVLQRVNADIKSIDEAINANNIELVKVQNSVDVCNNMSNMAISTADLAKNTADSALEAANDAVVVANNAKISAFAAEDLANSAKEDAQNAAKDAQESKESITNFINNYQKTHTFQLDYPTGNNNGIYKINLAEVFGDIDDSALYNVIVAETLVDSFLVYPSVSYAGSINSNGADNRTLEVKTEIPNQPTVITIHAYTRALHVREM